jgi:hypothetical protein
MQLAKKIIDVGLSTNNLEPMLRFWQQDAAVRFDHVLPVRRGPEAVSARRAGLRHQDQSSCRAVAGGSAERLPRIDDRKGWP